MRTSRERPKSASYLRLKSSKRTSKCQVFSFTETRKNPKVGPNWRAKRGNLSDFLTSILSQNINVSDWPSFCKDFQSRRLFGKTIRLVSMRGGENMIHGFESRSGIMFLGFTFSALCQFFFRERSSNLGVLTFKL